MNILKRTFCMNTLAKPLTTNKYITESLKHRDLIRVHGDDVTEFLQGLITNDMNHLNRGKSMYTMFLNNVGRVLYDSIIYSTREKNTYILECEKSIEYEFRRHLRMFRIRKKIDIASIGNDYTPWVIFSDNNSVPQLKNVSDYDDVLFVPDPRLKNLGSRLLVPKNYDIENIIELFHTDILFKPSDEKNNYKKLRYTLGVGEGIDDHPPTKCFPLESNIDYLHGISFQKGCYLGQELTARVHHTGVVRKRLMPLSLTKNPDKYATKIKLHNGNEVGTIRGVCGNSALALVRVEKVLRAPHLIIDGERAKITTPDWWPIALPSPKEEKNVDVSEKMLKYRKEQNPEAENTGQEAK